MIATSLITTLVITYLYISGVFIFFWFCLWRDLNWLRLNLYKHNDRNKWDKWDKWDWLLIISYLILVPYVNWLIFSRLEAVVNQQLVNQIFSYLAIVLMWAPLAFGLCFAIWILSTLLINLIQTSITDLYLYPINHWWFWIKHWKWVKQTFTPFYQNYLILKENSSDVYLWSFQLFQTTKTTYSVKLHFHSISIRHISIILQSNQLDDFVNLDFYQTLVRKLIYHKNEFANLNISTLIWDYQSKQIYLGYRAEKNLLISYQVDQDLLTFLDTKFLNCFDRYKQIYWTICNNDSSNYHFVKTNFEHLNWSDLKINAAQEIIWQYQFKHNLQVYQQHFSLIESKPNPKDPKDKAPAIHKHQQPLQISQITKIASVPTSRFNKGVKND